MARYGGDYGQRGPGGRWTVRRREYGREYGGRGGGRGRPRGFGAGERGFGAEQYSRGSSRSRGGGYGGAGYGGWGGERGGYREAGGGWGRGGYGGGGHAGEYRPRPRQYLGGGWEREWRRGSANRYDLGW